jgi:hypothetical protein
MFSGDQDDKNRDRRSVERPKVIRNTRGKTWSMLTVSNASKHEAGREISDEPTPPRDIPRSVHFVGTAPIIPSTSTLGA